MRLTTYGMWEEGRLSLLKNIEQDKSLQLSKEDIDEALLGPVVTEMLMIAGKCHQDNRAMALKERMLLAHKTSLACVLSALARALKKEEILLQAYVEEFTSNAYNFSLSNIDFLLKLATLSRECQEAGIAKLYGPTFLKQYPELVGLSYNDPALLKEAKELVVTELKQTCPSEILSYMLEHIKYMEEISSQKLADPGFASLFKAKTGFTMEEFKNMDINQTPGSSPSLNGHSSLWSKAPNKLESGAKAEKLRFN